MNFLAVAVAGALGAVSRYALSGAIARWSGSLPLGTFGVNMLGCLAIGLLAGWFGTRWSPDPALRVAVIGGFLGAFTTFSAFGWETWEMARRGDWLPAVAYVLASVVVGVAAVAVGATLASR